MIPPLAVPFPQMFAGLPAAAIPLAIFVLRTLDLTLSTLRMLAILRGHRAIAWVLGFFGALLFVTAIAGVLTTLGSGWSLLAYAAGYATGSWIGMTIERRLAPGQSLLRVFTPGSGQAVAEALRAGGQGATWITARPPGGDLVLCYAPRRSVRRLSELAAAADPACAITTENVRWLRGGSPH
jgi:uncharacterized protein YebE (UPF0316 family)